MQFLLYLGFVLALCGISYAAPAVPAALSQYGQLSNYCSVTTIYVTVTDDPLLPNIKTFSDAPQHLGQTQNVGAIPDELTTTVTRTNTGFETITVAVDTSRVSRSDAQIGESTSIRFLHDGPAPAGKTTTFQPATATGSSEIPVTVNTTSLDLSVPTGTDVSKSPLMDNTGSQYLTAPTGTAATNDPVTVNTTSQILEAPTGTQPGSGNDDVVTVTVYPIKSIVPETGSNDTLSHTVAVPPTSHDPASTSIFPNSSEATPTQTVGILANVTVRAPSPPQLTNLAPRDTESSMTLKLPFIGTITFPVDTSKAATYTSGQLFSTYNPGIGEIALNNPVPPPADDTTSIVSQPPATVVQSPRSKPASCGEQGIFRLTFDDLPRLAGPADQPQPVSNPYHHFYFSPGFAVAPFSRDTYTPQSAPHLVKFVVPRNADATGILGIGQNLRWGCYDFNALAASVGCDSSGPRCDWQFTGVQFDHRAQAYKEVATQFVSTAGCPGLNACKLTDVVLLDDFMHLHALKVNVTAAGKPRSWWMDDLKLEWADGSCDAGLCRVKHR